jgi:hypothetical protein
MTVVAAPEDTPMSTPHAPHPGTAPTARWLLVALSLLFTLGGLGQFLLVGLGMFDDAARWQDHKTFGSVLGLLTYVMWIPALLGRTGQGTILATVVLFVAYMLQYVFINASSGIANAFHPLNGALMLVLSSWITFRALGLARGAGRSRLKESPA